MTRIVGEKKLAQFNADFAGLVALVQEAMRRGDYDSVAVLLRYGASPAHLVLKAGSTALHTALQVALEFDKGQSNSSLILRPSVAASRSHVRVPPPRGVLNLYAKSAKT